MSKSLNSSRKSAGKAEPRARVPFKQTYKTISQTQRVSRGLSLLALQADEKNSDIQKSLSVGIGVSRGLLNNRLYHLQAGSATYLSTTAASVASFSITTGPVLLSAVSATTVPDITALNTLFDEVKVCGITVRYQPINPYNRGAVTVSVPMALFWDDVDNFTPANSLANFGVLSNRYPMFHAFSPDIPFSYTFLRPTAMSEYDWSATSVYGNEPSTKGGLYIVGDGTNTASINYGILEYSFLFQFRLRV